MKIIYIVKLLMMAFFFVYFSGCNNEQKKIENRQTEKNETISNTVKIGNQEWMAENLNVETYRNGDPIPQVQDAEKWSSLTSGAWCYYENNSENEITFGKLYNWYVVTDPRGLAPKGWHIPSEEEWKELEDYAGGKTKVLPADGVITSHPTIIDGGASKLIANKMWDKYEGIKITNKYRFSALPGGARMDNGKFSNPLKVCLFWSSGEKSVKFQWFRYHNIMFMDMVKYKHKKNDGLSVRCIKD